MSYRLEILYTGRPLVAEYIAVFEIFKILDFRVDFPPSPFQITFFLQIFGLKTQFRNTEVAIKQSFHFTSFSAFHLHFQLQFVFVSFSIVYFSIYVFSP